MLQHAVGVVAVEMVGALARCHHARAGQITASADHRIADGRSHVALGRTGFGAVDGGLHPGLGCRAGPPLVGDFGRGFDEPHALDQRLLIGPDDAGQECGEFFVACDRYRPTAQLRTDTGRCT